MLDHTGRMKLTDLGEAKALDVFFGQAIQRLLEGSLLVGGRMLERK